ncbi:MAG TPA: carboxypeptidase-like regulatory domain-containing protein [Blastocatellia bacterium]|nr:carboxypeptidase-like regulatory domain-containing protein [Blastocatellia bacterium]
MKLHSKIALLIMTAATLTWFVNDARACSCEMPGLPCQAYWTTSAVFVGLVTNISQPPADADVNGARPFRQRLIHFSLEQAFRGVEGKEVEAATGMGGGDCGYDFKMGERYLVYAYRNPDDNRLSVGICSRTRPLAEAGEDLEYIRGLAKAPPGGRVFGQVMQYSKDLKNESGDTRSPMAGTKVIIEGQGKRYEVVTDAQGNYQMTGLAAGDYQVRLVIPERLGGHVEDKVVVPDRGCAQENFLAQLDGQISGVVTNAEGQPVPGVGLNLILADPADAGPGGPKGEMASTDEAGHYVFNLIPPGRYLLGVNLMYPPHPEQPYRRTYYPGAVDEAQASVIVMGKGSKLNGYDLRLPPRLTERAIEGVVVLPSGRSGARVSVSIEAEDYPWWVRNSVEADDRGRFSIKALEGVRYIVHADLLADGQPGMHAEPARVLVGEKTEPIKLVITLEGSSYLRNRRRQ